MSLPLDARFGLDTPDDEFDGREIMLICGALSSQLRYSRGMALRNKDAEAAGRNHVNALEYSVLLEKVQRIGRHKAVSLQ